MPVAVLGGDGRLRGNGHRHMGSGGWEGTTRRRWGRGIQTRDTFPLIPPPLQTPCRWPDEGAAGDPLNRNRATHSQGFHWTRFLGATMTVFVFIRPFLSSFLSTFVKSVVARIDRSWLSTFLGPERATPPPPNGDPSKASGTPEIRLEGDSPLPPSRARETQKTLPDWSGCPQCPRSGKYS